MNSIKIGLITLCIVWVFGLVGCTNDKQAISVDKSSAGSVWVGEGMVGSAGEKELASVSVIIGDKSGPAGIAFSTGLASQREGHPSVIAVLEPNTAVKPSTLLVSQVTLKDMKLSVNFFGPVQVGVASAIADAVAEKVIAKEKCEDLVIIVTVFIHPEAEDNNRLYQNNYEAVKLAIQRAMAGKPSADEVLKVRQNK